MNPAAVKTVIGLAATLGPLLGELVKKGGDPEKVAAIEKELKHFEERILENFWALERELVFAKWAAYASLAIACLALAISLKR
ncbi:MAG: hypothetical protein CO113_02540 [Elusimicrobia bacterium CG_4_9_14_3_um_filter_62_55]|nr:MAG: hypothetical protein COR54_05125 [Elusimicrobia bacterium CG22_combo_CG10-13_8_21_14_all_63_91]PJA17748.1 MAG: hypothetical protein COX66_03550 [Elusimicrobia bacterium CG_4_10_14_0_2_um_filter_63_34]PJB26659.1 MAG: hypothetical protein CO113_02540 [Elusimicrobia bacterium CG_4_9_14_3_um_filter_62_55]